jgi:predicted regulator of amino acid metabolism with ACT domain
MASFAMVAVLAGGTVVAFHDSPCAMVGTAATVLFIIINHGVNIREYRAARAGARKGELGEAADE